MAQGAEDNTQQHVGGAQGKGGGGEALPKLSVDWKTLWPVALTVAAGVMLVLGLITAVQFRPEPDVGAPLRHAAALIEDEEFQKAVDVLNGQMLPYIHSEQATREQQAQFHRTRAEAFALGQRVKGIDHRQNHEQAVADYRRAQSLGLVLDPSDLTLLAESLLGLDRVGEAREIVDRMPLDAQERRRELIKTIVKYNLDAPVLNTAMTLGLIEALLSEPGVGPEDRQWAVARQAELLIEDLRPQDAITRLLREMQHFEHVAGGDVGELQLMLGRAYFETGQIEAALDHLERAEAALAEFDPQRAQSLLYIGQIMQAQGSYDEAKDRYLAVQSGFSSTRSYLPALLGLAEVAASQGEDDVATDQYAQVIGELAQEPWRRDINPRQVKESLLAWYENRMSTDQPKEALQYAQLADSVFHDLDVPPDVLMAMATAHRTVADRTIERAQIDPNDPTSMQLVDPVTRNTAKQHFLYAGDIYLRYARHPDVVVFENNAFLDAVWLAAESFDHGGDMMAAQNAYSLYHEGASNSDPKRAEAKFKLAQTFQAMGDFGAAVPLFGELIDATEGPEAPKGVGQWATRSVTPLAQCLLLDEEPANDEQAEGMLVALLNNHELSPESLEYRDAHVQLCRYYYEKELFSSAAQELELVVERYPSHPQIEVLEFWLADSYRQSAAQLEEELREAMPTAERRAKEAEREKRLRMAIDLYDSVRRRIEAMDQNRLLPAQEVYLRNSYFYPGDCAYELKEYAKAIEYYDTAKQAYAHDPSSLVALVQIVNAYVEQGMWDKAATAQSRAQQHFKRLDMEYGEDGWDTGRLPMERKHWERWLESRILIEQQQQMATGT